MRAINAVKSKTHTFRQVEKGFNVPKSTIANKITDELPNQNGRKKHR